jgi:hypothetical protein
MPGRTSVKGVKCNPEVMFSPINTFILTSGKGKVRACLLGRPEQSVVFSPWLAYRTQPPFLEQIGKP